MPIRREWFHGDAESGSIRAAITLLEKEIHPTNVRNTLLSRLRYRRQAIRERPIRVPAIDHDGPLLAEGLETVGCSSCFRRKMGPARSAGESAHEALRHIARDQEETGKGICWQILWRKD